MSTSAIVRQELEKLPGVKRTWFEWEFETDANRKTLIVEVAFETHPNNSDFDSSALNDIRETCLDVLRNKTPMIISRLRVIPACR